MSNAKIEAIANADAHTSNAGLPTYSDLLTLLNQAKELGLTFARGSAYISAAYIVEQTELRARIRDANLAVAEAS